MNTTTSSRPWLAPLLVFVIAFAGMSRIVTNDFVDWDDSFTLYANARMNPPTARTLEHYWTHTEHGIYVPVTQTVWALLAKIAYTPDADARGIRLDPRVFHVTSVTLHAIAAVIAFLLLRRLLNNDIASALGALLFALHPVQVESVAWAAGMKDVLCGLFSLIALWQYVIAAQRSALVATGTSPWGSDPARLHYLVATSAFVIAMLCKPSAMVLPALAVAIHVTLLCATWRTALMFTTTWWPLAVVIAIIARAAQTVTQVDSPLLLRPLVALDALAFYLLKILAPLNLCIDYGRSPTTAFDAGWLYFTWLLPAAVIAALYLKPRREVIAAALIATICVAPVLGLTTFMFQYYSTVADHYLYLAMLGPSLALAWFVAKGKPLPRVIAVAALAVLAGKSLTQQATWRDDEALFTHTLAVNPDSFMALNNLASAHTVAADIMTFNAKVASDIGDRLTAEVCRARAIDNHRRAAGLYAAAIVKRKHLNRGVDDYHSAHQALADTRAKLDAFASTAAD